MPSIDIALDGRTITLPPLTLRQLRGIAIALGAGAAAAQHGDAEAGAFDQMVAVVGAALSEDGRETKRDDILGMRATLPELIAAHRAILAHGGFTAAGAVMADAAPGAAAGGDHG
jgi:hypothetical protein